MGLVLSGYGAGYGYGDGSGDGSGYGDGYGSGAGSGYGYGDGYGDGYGAGSGYGDGYGSGYGAGYGSGAGSGYGDGSGDGDGYGYGDGSGYGDGYGAGDGYGYGSGAGYGYGDGYGDGDGQDSQGYFLKMIDHYGGEIGRKRVEEDGAVLAVWKSNKDGTPANGGGGGARHAGMVEEIRGPLQLCTKNALHATLNPGKWEGDKWWVVALYPPIAEESDKIGSLKREIIAEIK